MSEMSAPTIRELEAMLKALGWKLTKLADPNKTTGRYVAKGTGPAGQSGERDGDTPERALANLLTFAQHHNAIRSFASLGQKIAVWSTPWSSQLDEIGHAYGQLPVYDPKAVSSWHALANESAMQADAIRRQLNVRETDDPEPYPHHAAMLHDIHHNQNFVVSRAHSDHPVWSQPDNVNFRIVHDVLGHGQSGGDFGWEGENRACGVHFPMVSPLARRALFTECIGQTAYALRKGSHGFGPQKVGLMPQFLDHTEEMNGEHVHVPSGKLIYPENAMPIDNAAWGWHQDPQNGKWVQQTNPTDTAEQPSGVGQNAAHRRRHASGGIASPGLAQHVAPHNMTPQEYPPRPEYRQFGVDNMPLTNTINTPGDDPLILPETAVDPNHYDHSLTVAPLTQAGAPNDYLDKQGTINNADTLATNWMDESHDRQVMAVRNACMAAIISPRKPLMWNAAQYQTLMNVPIGAPLGDFFKAWGSGRELHNFRHGHQEVAHPVAWNGEGDWRPQVKLLQQHFVHFEGMDDKTAWHEAHDYLAKLYAHFEPYGMEMVQKENEQRQLGQTWEEGVGARPYQPGEKKRKQMDENEIRSHMMTSRMVADFLHHQFGKTGAPEGQLPGTDLISQPVQPDEWNELLPKAAGILTCADCGTETGGPFKRCLDCYGKHTAAVPHQPFHKMAGFIYKHMEKLPELTPSVCNQLLAYAKKDMEEDNGRGYVWRAGAQAMGVPGLDNKTLSYAWLMLAPHTSELGIIDTHAARSMGFEDAEIEKNGGANYHAMERMQRHMKDASGYGDLPLGQYHWGHWDMARSPGYHSDHSALRPLDPAPYDDANIEYGHDSIDDRKQTPIYIGPPEFMQHLATGHQLANQYLASIGGQPLPTPMNLDPTNVSMPEDASQLGTVPVPVRAASTGLDPFPQFKVGDMVRFAWSTGAGPEHFQFINGEVLGQAQGPDGPQYQVKTSQGTYGNIEPERNRMTLVQGGDTPDYQYSPFEQDSPEDIDGMVHGAGWVPMEHGSPHGGPANTGDVVCPECNKRIIGDVCRNCGHQVDGSEQPVIAGPYDPEREDMQEGWQEQQQSPLHFQQSDDPSTWHHGWADPNLISPGFRKNEPGEWAAVNDGTPGPRICPLCGGPETGKHPRDYCPVFQRRTGAERPGSIDFGKLVEQHDGDANAAMNALYDQLQASGMDRQHAWSAANEYYHNWSSFNPTHHQLETYPERYAPDAKPRTFGEVPERTDMSDFEDAMQAPAASGPYDHIEDQAWLLNKAMGGDTDAAERHNQLANQHGEHATDMTDFEQAIPSDDPKQCPLCGGSLIATQTLDNHDVVECKSCSHEFMQTQDGGGLQDMGVNEKARFGPSNLGQLPAFPEPEGESVEDTFPSEWS